MSKRITKKTKFLPIDSKEYKDGIFVATGLVKNSPHKRNTVYMRIADQYFHFTDDEVYAVLTCLSNALWHRGIKYTKMVWLTLKKLEKKYTKGGK